MSDSGGHCPKCGEEYIRRRKVAENHGFGNWFVDPHGYWYVHEESQEGNGLIHIEDQCYVVIYQ